MERVGGGNTRSVMGRGSKGRVCCMYGGYLCISAVVWCWYLVIGGGVKKVTAISLISTL